MNNFEIMHIKSGTLFYVYNLYVDGKDTEQIVTSTDIFTKDYRESSNALARRVSNKKLKKAIENERQKVEI